VFLARLLESRHISEFSGRIIVSEAQILAKCHQLNFADFYELDASFRAIRPFVNVVPLPVIKMRVFPCGSDSDRVSPSKGSLIAEALIAHGLDSKRLRELPLLSDEGAALLPDHKLYHLFHDACFRHWLEAGGSRKLAAMLARRLLFTQTESVYLAICEQTGSDCVDACHTGDVTENAQKKFGSISGIVLPLPSAPFVLPKLCEGKYLSQASWSTRGRHGVSACSNHTECLHRRLKVTTASHRKTAKGSRTTGPEGRSKRNAGSPHISLNVQNSSVGDQGAILSRRFQCPLPCIHKTLSRHDDKRTPLPAPDPGFRIDGKRMIRRFVHAGRWGDSTKRKKMVQLSFPLAKQPPIHSLDQRWTANQRVSPATYSTSSQLQEVQHSSSDPRKRIESSGE
jgi:hypothetical protein